MKSKGYAKFLGANKLHYGRCASGESFLPELFTAISRKVSQKMCMLQSQKVLGCCRTYFCCFALALADICPWPLLPFFQISLKNSELKTTHNTFRGCHVHFIRQPCTAWRPFEVCHAGWMKPWLFVTTFCIIIQKAMLRDEGVMPGNSAVWQNRFRNITLP